MSNNEKYSLHCNDCLRGQVDKKEDYRSRGWEFTATAFELAVVLGSTTDKLHDGVPTDFVCKFT